MRILEGVGTLIQLAGLAARLCKMVCGTVIVFYVRHSYFDQELEAELMRAGGIDHELKRDICINKSLVVILVNVNQHQAVLTSNCRQWQLKRRL